MIVANVSDPRLREALLRVAHPEEEVVCDEDLVLAAIDSGYPRLLVEADDGRPTLADLTSAPTVRLEMARRKGRRFDDYLTELRERVEQRSVSVSWVDRTLADLGRAAGQPLPPALRAFARRVLEFPSHYDDLQPLARSCGTSRGALKARFRRRGVPSPYSYLRWFRILAVANSLADPEVTVAATAHTLGFTSDGNLCRTMVGLTGLTPTEVRTRQGWNRLLLGFAWEHLTAEALAGWRDFEELFVRSA